MAVGSWEDIAPLAGPGTEIIDGRGQLVLPGLLDGHTHAVKTDATQRCGGLRRLQCSRDGDGQAGARAGEGGGVRLIRTG